MEEVAKEGKVAREEKVETEEVGKEEVGNEEAGKEVGREEVVEEEKAKGQSRKHRPDPQMIYSVLHSRSPNLRSPSNDHLVPGSLAASEIGFVVKVQRKTRPNKQQ